MPQQIVIVEQAEDWSPDFPDVPVVLADDYLTDTKWAGARNTRVINLCRSSRYLSVGYYVSLLAEARGHRIVPDVRTMLDLRDRFSVTLAARTLGKTLAQAKPPPTNGEGAATAEADIYFGLCEQPELQPLARRIFETVPCPLLHVKLEPAAPQGVRIVSLQGVALHQVPKRRREFFAQALNRYLGRRWQKQRQPVVSRYDLAILHDPADPLPPSDEKALARFVKAGARLGVDVELITRDDLGFLAEYDALFIRETTRVAHHTFRFAKKAEKEGIPVIDDPESILRCANKVYLAELLRANGVPAPRTLVVGRGDLDALERELPYPMVVKMPEGAFSRGVFKVQDRADLERVAAQLFEESELFLAQAYTYTPFDWRIGVLDRKPLYACQYFMSKAHWQIVKYDSQGGFKEGAWKTLPVEQAPPEVVDTAVRAAGLIGDGLYGVDLKQTADAVLVIEVNDNPSIEAGVEDKVLGNALYERIIEDFIRRIEARRARTR